MGGMMYNSPIVLKVYRPQYIHWAKLVGQHEIVTAILNKKRVPSPVTRAWGFLLHFENQNVAGFQESEELTTRR